MRPLLRDLHYGIRTLRQNVAFTTVAILSLAIGIGANTAIFQLIDTVRLRSLPVFDPQSLVMVKLTSAQGWRGSQASPHPALTNPQWEHLRDSQDVFSGMLAWWENGFGLGSGGELQMSRGVFVSGDFFRVLGVPALRGRVFTAADDRRGCGLPGAVISYAFWQRHFGGDPSAIGSKLTVNYQQVEILGVTPSDFSGLEIGHSYDIAVPICSQPSLWSEGAWLDRGTVWWLTVIGRLKPGMTIAQTNARLEVLSPGLFRATLPPNYPRINVPDYLKFRLTSVPAPAGVSQLRDRYADPLGLLLITAGLVLLIACANLANLMLARATAREHEIAVRLAIGASRVGLIRQLMAESLLLATAGTGLGLLLSRGLSHFLLAMLATKDNPLSLDLSPDRAVLAFTTAAATLTCILFGLIPAWRATRVAAGDAIRAKGRGQAGNRERFGLRQVLVVSQVALSLVLLVGALLFSGSLRKLMGVDAGFRQDGILVTSVDYRRLPIPKDRRLAFNQEILDRFRSVPGIDGAAEVDILPLSGGSTGNAVWLEGTDRGKGIAASFNWIGDGYLTTMGIPLLAGRDFNRHDVVGTPLVAIVNQTFTKKLGLEHPIGKRFRRESTPGSPETVVEIVGLVPDTKYNNLREPPRQIAFLSIDQDDNVSPDAQFVIRSSAPFPDTISRIRSIITATSPEITMDFRSFAGTIAQGLIRERLMATLSSFFGILATLIAALGLYGVMSYLVARRTNEIGVRVALGAGRGDILSLILRQSAALLSIGLAVGIVLAMAAGRYVSSLLFGLKPNDTLTFGLAILMLAAITQAASYVPARRAAGLEPMTALRED